MVTNTDDARFAVLFPGQGSQSVGMLQGLAQEYEQVQATFTEASTALDVDLWQVCQDEARLNQTQFTQPALVAGSMAIWRILQDHFTYAPVYLAGHSLGEYSALCAAGVLSLKDTVQLVHQRGQLMQQAVADQDTAMAAVLGLDDDKVISLCARLSDQSDTASVSAANFNSPGQVVIAGNRDGVDLVVDQVKSMGKKAILLKVSVPSHCALMQPASEQLAEALSQVTFAKPTIKVIQNRHARVEENTADIKHALIEQLCQPVRWAHTMQLLAKQQVAWSIECGAGNVLSNLSKRQQPVMPCLPTDKPERLHTLLKEMSL